MRAALDAALALTPVVVQEAAAPVAASATDFESLYAEWLKEHTYKPRGRDGRPPFRSRLLRASTRRWSAFSSAQARQNALRVEALYLAFYQDFRTYLVEELARASTRLL